MHLSAAELGLVAKSEPSMQTRWTRSDIEAKLRELTARLDGLDGFKQEKAIVTENVGLFPSSRSKTKFSSNSNPLVLHPDPKKKKKKKNLQSLKLLNPKKISRGKFPANSAARRNLPTHKFEIRVIADCRPTMETPTTVFRSTSLATTSLDSFTILDEDLFTTPTDFIQ